MTIKLPADSPIMTRAEALSLGLRQFRSATPCSRNHSNVIRYTQAGSCVQCHRESRSSEKTCWYNMLARCLNKNHPDYANYGGRGIKIAPRWLIYENFIADLGKKPHKSCSIERHDVDGDYTYSNTYWSSRKRQAANKRQTQWIEMDGCRIPLAWAAKSIGVLPATVRQRAKRWNVSLQQALDRHRNDKSLISRPHKKFDVDGRQMNLTDIARYLGVGYRAIIEMANRRFAGDRQAAVEHYLTVGVKGKSIIGHSDARTDDVADLAW